MTVNKLSAIVKTEVSKVYDKFLLRGLAEVKVFNKKKNATIFISRKSILSLYEGLTLKRAVISKIIKAHIKVLKYGLKTGNERIIAIDSKTGRIEADETGTPFQVEWSLKPNYRGKVITVHNHPSSTPFSPIDLYYFGVKPYTLCMGVQGHNGRMYSLRKTTDTEFSQTIRSLELVMFAIKRMNKGKTEKEIGELFVQTIAGAMNWVFERGDEIDA